MSDREPLDRIHSSYDFTQALLAGDKVMMDAQVRLIREAYYAIDNLLKEKPMLAAFNYNFPDGRVAGTLGNLRVELKRDARLGDNNANG